MSYSNEPGKGGSKTVGLKLDLWVQSGKGWKKGVSRQLQVVLAQSRLEGHWSDLNLGHVNGHKQRIQRYGKGMGTGGSNLPDKLLQTEWVYDLQVLNQACRFTDLACYCQYIMEDINFNLSKLVMGST